MARVFELDKARNNILNDIVCCYQCCKPVNSKYFWVGEKCTIKNELVRHRISQKYWQALVDGLRCPNCKAKLELESMVEVITPYDRKVEILLYKSRHSPLVRELAKLNQFLGMYPYLGSGDPDGTGNNIRDAINRQPRQVLDSKPWFKARHINPGIIFTSEDMTVPDPKKVPIGEGRYNHAGQSFLYLSDEPETALCEINQWGDATKCAMQKYRATEQLEVLDLRHDDRKLNLDTDLLLIAIIYNGYLEDIPEQGTSWKPEYFVPRFLADCARLEGFEGIWYSSVWDFGENLAVFPEKISAFARDGNCEIYRTKTKTIRI